jgi:hypothetical protein
MAPKEKHEPPPESDLPPPPPPPDIVHSAISMVARHHGDHHIYQAGRDIHIGEQHSHEPSHDFSDHHDPGHSDDANGT